MIIGGFQKLSLIDYPGKMCAVIYTRGCNMRCSYCHNPELVWPEQYGPEIGFDSIAAFLHQRQGLLDAVTISGGEPTLHKDLPEIIRKIKDLGFLVKLDTNGSNPAVLRVLLENRLLDYVAMDIKAPLEKYDQLSGIEVDDAKIMESIQILQRGNVNYEFRTTVDRSYLDEDDLLKIGALIRGAKKYYLQVMNPNDTKHEGSAKDRRTDEVWLQIVAVKLDGLIDFCAVR